jgi:hypothetical protein
VYLLLQVLSMVQVSWTRPVNVCVLRSLPCRNSSCSSNSRAGHWVQAACVRAQALALQVVQVRV